VPQWSFNSMALPAVLLLASLLTACAGPSGTVPIDDRSRGGHRTPQVTTGTHVVQRGETLYQIAFRYGWDWKELAAKNRLRQPYTIYPAQPINLATRVTVTPAAAQTPPP